MLLSQNLDKLAARGRDAADLEPIQTYEIRPPVPTTRYDWVTGRRGAGTWITFARSQTSI